MFSATRAQVGTRIDDAVVFYPQGMAAEIRGLLLGADCCETNVKLIKAMIAHIENVEGQNEGPLVIAQL